ncbi:MAG TPA: FAD:protein FMN transferase [Acidimicrobiales bacterium]|nr:FAD:protein FMN transferase [Acidimicrobiales bacterium]
MEPGEDEVVVRTRAMASEITLRARQGDPRTRPAGRTVDADRAARLEGAIARALEVFHEVERVCTRFDAASPMSHANAAPDRWHVVPDLLLAAVAEAYGAHRRSAGRFDPRVLASLLALGYRESTDFSEMPELGAPPADAHRSGPLAPWRPRIRHARRSVHLGGDAVDLGGIGKGLAVRWAAALLAAATSDFLVDAGGDIYCSGRAPDSGPWMLGVEDPLGGDIPVAVIGVSNAGVATSSVRVRRWTSGGLPVHHLIDPSTGRPGGDGLVAVTVVAPDPATAEVWSKVLFLAGADGIGAAARQRRVAALWIESDGSVAHAADMAPILEWRAR